MVFMRFQVSRWLGMSAIQGVPRISVGASPSSSSWRIRASKASLRQFIFKLSRLSTLSLSWNERDFRRISGISGDFLQRASQRCDRTRLQGVDRRRLLAHYLCDLRRAEPDVKPKYQRLTLLFGEVLDGRSQVQVFDHSRGVAVGMESVSRVYGVNVTAVAGSLPDVLAAIFAHQVVRDPVQPGQNRPSSIRVGPHAAY